LKKPGNTIAQKVIRKVSRWMSLNVIEMANVSLMSLNVNVIHENVLTRKDLCLSQFFYWIVKPKPQNQIFQIFIYYSSHENRVWMKTLCVESLTETESNFFIYLNKNHNIRQFLCLIVNFSWSHRIYSWVRWKTLYIKNPSSKYVSNLKLCIR